MMSQLTSQNAMSSLPMGFGMALLQNKEAREVYDSLPLNRQIEILDGVHKIQSKAEMLQYVASILELR